MQNDREDSLIAFSFAYTTDELLRESA